MFLSLQLYKMLHLVGFSLLTGGTLTSLLMNLRRENPFVAQHLVAAPGLMLIWITGLAQSWIREWVNFKGSGYMHAKLTLVIFATLFLALDIKRKKPLWAFLGFVIQIFILGLIVWKPF
ncbi:MAG: hypothetical protein I8H75_01945 [Myxococcaceae bacterium]|nr:hypothetical protein [Myxococcaceae bacterium]MBH2006099.1 hypothetical protein [Myxococcaceae bacterium]